MHEASSKTHYAASQLCAAASCNAAPKGTRKPHHSHDLQQVAVDLQAGTADTARHMVALVSNRLLSPAHLLF